MRNVKVHLGPQTYGITLGKNTMAKLATGLKKYFPSREVVIITNKTVAKLYHSKISSLLASHWNAQWIEIPDGERHKNLKTVESIYHQLLKAKAHRKTGIIAFGGGVVGDIAGFVAATYLRGIPFVQIPTTLLAQVDSSVGGKTGVDLKSGKNLVGAFYQPKWVLIDTQFLTTLPHREFLCGLSEVVKYGILGDKKLFEFMEKNVGKILAMDHNALLFLIKHSCQMKANLVSKDEKESGLRSLLNLGHTLGHGIETLSGYTRIHHGEAVSQGMAYAALLSSKRGFCSQNDTTRIVNLLKSLGLPTKLPKFSKTAYQNVLSRDKKSAGQTIRYVAIQKIGKAFLCALTKQEITAYL